MKTADCIKQAGTQHTIKSDLLKPISLKLQLMIMLAI